MEEDKQRLREEMLLWEDFQKSAQAVGLLYNDVSWKHMQNAAFYTTQLYKSGIDHQRRAFERGFFYFITFRHFYYIYYVL